MTQELQKLNNRHYKIIDFCLRGFTNRQIAEQLSITDQAVSIIINSPIFKHELALRRSALSEIKDERIAVEEDDVARTLRDGAIKAAAKLVLNTNCGNPGAENSACEAILDRTGYSRVTKQENKSVGVQITITKELADVIRSTLDMEQA